MVVLQEEKTVSTEPSLISKERALEILKGEIPLFEIVGEASKARLDFQGKLVKIHILDNIKNGNCPEDCGYCAQRKNGNSGVQEFMLKDESEIIKDAKQAKDNGAYRFCMVTSGTGPNDATITKLSNTIHKITSELNMKVCLSAGLLDESKVKLLKEAGLDRYNHNLNTSESHYGEICTTHSYKDRLKTLELVRNSSIGLCSGMIVGMGESLEDLVEVAFELKRLKVISIPLNFFIPIAGHAIKNPGNLTPEFCIRILSMFRLVNPDAEIRMGAGREGHIRGLQSLGLFVADSLFASGYLNVKGSDIQQTVQMILDAGFVPEFEEGHGGSMDEVLKSLGHLYSAENIKNLYKFRKN